jgi:hypothetical protein
MLFAYPGKTGLAARHLTDAPLIRNLHDRRAFWPS